MRKKSSDIPENKIPPASGETKSESENPPALQGGIGEGSRADAREGSSEKAGHAEPWREAKAMLAKEFNIASAFVRVKTLAKILGLSQVTVYTSIREGRFFIPHRMLNSSPAVRLEDLARWYVSDGGSGGEDDSGKAGTRSALADELLREEAADKAAAKAAEEEARAAKLREKERIGHMVDGVLETLNIERKSPRRRRRQ